MLSRFTPKKEVRRTLDELESGEADVVIGTHRLLGKDVKFKDPGLFVIDEEHRFGVGHKEQIKELKKELDVLTLSATPIPRTLHMVHDRNKGYVRNRDPARAPLSGAHVCHGVFRINGKGSCIEGDGQGRAGVFRI